MIKQWIKVLYQYLPVLRIKYRDKFETYIYDLHRLYVNHLQQLYDSMKLFPRNRVYRSSNMLPPVPPFYSLLEDIRHECKLICDDFFDKFDNSIYQTHNNFKIKNRIKIRNDIKNKTRHWNYALKYLPKEIRILIARYYTKKCHFNICYCVIYNKKKCPRCIDRM